MNDETLNLLRKIVDDSTDKNGEINLIKIGSYVLKIVRSNQ